MSEHEGSNTQLAGNTSGGGMQQRVMNRSRFAAELRPDARPGPRLAPGSNTVLEIRDSLSIILSGTSRITVLPGPAFANVGTSSREGSVTVQLRRTRASPKVGDIEITNPPG
ncbi:hypothetical protein CYPRO_1228 [Cyclonatronum proteinivorum]|uniref:Uncharacterized protein n=1 Tax=Cyclonatronum proteinivorum TaxID=1457365 RepID=A0A345UJ39_9BACT|nr:hypothetical protein CYPRO_1228 [Cyclonatronum proteinivorum]